MSITDLFTSPVATAAAEALRLANTPEGLAAIRQVAIRPDISFDDLAKKVHDEVQNTQGPAEAPDAPSMPKEG